MTEFDVVAWLRGAVISFFIAVINAGTPAKRKRHVIDSSLILTAITDLPSEDRKTLIDRMHTEMVEKVNAKAADEAKRARIDRLNAAKADASTRFEHRIAGRPSSERRC